MKVFQSVNSLFASNTYVCVGRTGAWVIDPGDAEECFAFLGESILSGVFVTHSHFDHIYGLNSLLEQFPELVVYVSAYGKEALYSDRLNFSMYHESPFVFKGENVVVLKEGDKVDLGDGLGVEVYETPGHDPGCLCYKVENYFFTGDSFIPGVPTVTKLRGGDKKASKASLEKIMGLVTRETIVCPGHGKMIGGGECLDRYF